MVREIAHTLSQRMLFLNPARALPLIERTIETIETEIGETFDLDVLTGLLLHLTCVMEQGIQANKAVNETIRLSIQRRYSRELAICQQAWQTLSQQIARPLPKDEAYNIVSILKHIDIFTH
jgi:transcriptional regulatory protein LevR